MQPAEPITPLPEALELFAAFRQDGVRYCQFKSNEHLLAGLAGLTDLDVLVDPRDAGAARAALARAGFKRFDNTPSASYPSVEDYLGFSGGCGRLIHVQIHYSLILGEKHLKGHQLGYWDKVLETRALDAETGVFTSDPHYEMQLLMLRYALKIRWRDYALELLGRRFFGSQPLVEYRWLQQRIARERLQIITAEELGKDAALLMDGLVSEPPDIWKLRRFRRAAAPALAGYRRFGVVEGFVRRALRELNWLLGGLNKRLLRLPRPLHRTNPSGGRIVAFLGPDGSGKSTIVADTRRWLAWKLDAYPVYFGSGMGKASLLRWPLRLALRSWRRLRPRRPRRAAEVGPPARASAARAIWALALALEKRGKMRAAIRARNRGMVVVCDRYPQTQVMGFNDGPLLSGWSESPWRWRRFLSRWEADLYRWASANAPDLAIKLEVSPEVAVSRKPEMSQQELEARIVAVAQIDYGPRCEHRVIENSRRPLEQVLRDVREAVWERL